MSVTCKEHDVIIEKNARAEMRALRGVPRDVRDIYMAAIGAEWDAMIKAMGPRPSVDEQKDAECAFAIKCANNVQAVLGAIKFVCEASVAPVVQKMRRENACIGLTEPTV